MSYKRVNKTKTPTKKKKASTQTIKRKVYYIPTFSDGRAAWKYLENKVKDHVKNSQTVTQQEINAIVNELVKYFPKVVNGYHEFLIEQRNDLEVDFGENEEWINETKALIHGYEIELMDISRKDPKYDKVYDKLSRQEESLGMAQEELAELNELLDKNTQSLNAIRKPLDEKPIEQKEAEYDYYAVMEKKWRELDR